MTLPPISLERVLDVVSDVVIVFDPQLRIVEQNEACRAAMRAVGADPETAVGRHIVDVVPELAGTVGLQQAQRALDERVATVWEEAYAPGMCLRGRAFPTEGGGIIVVASNVAAEQDARLEIERSNRRTDELFQLSTRLAAAADVSDVAGVVLAEARTALGIERGSVGTVARGADLVRLVASLGYTTAQADEWASYSLRGATVSREAMETQAPIFHPSRQSFIARHGESSGTYLERDGIEAFAAIPVAIAGNAHVLFGFAWSEAREFPAAERSYIRAFAAQSAQAFERAMAFEAEREARTAAEMANRAKSQFLAAMSHELRTPLNAIGGYTDLLAMGLRGPLTEQQQEDIRRIGRNQAHLMTIISDILDFARLEAGRVELEIRPLLAREIVSDVEPLVAPQLAQKHLAFTLDAGDPAIAVRADREKVGRVLLNLIDNATKFTPPGGAIQLNVGAVDGKVRIDVRDTGVGIPGDKLGSIFEPFVQAHRSLNQPSPGTGLGLAISRDLARAMGGDITVRSEVGRGSTFTLTLPRP